MSLQQKHLQPNTRKKRRRRLVRMKKRRKRRKRRRRTRKWVRRVEQSPMQNQSLLQRCLPTLAIKRTTKPLNRKLNQRLDHPNNQPRSLSSRRSRTKLTLSLPSQPLPERRNLRRDQTAQKKPPDPKGKVRSNALQRKRRKRLSLPHPREKKKMKKNRRSRLRVAKPRRKPRQLVRIPS